MISKPTKTTRPRGFIESYRPTKKTQQLIDDVKAVLQEYVQYLPLTLRQIFYRLVGSYDYAKTLNLYQRLIEVMTRARRAKLIPFSAIRDDRFDISDEWWFEEKAD